LNLIALAENVARDTLARIRLHEELDYAVWAESEPDGPKLIVVLVMPGVHENDSMMVPLRFPTLNPSAELIDQAVQEGITRARAERASLMLERERKEAGDAVPEG
jgi:hypothetical protein